MFHETRFGLNALDRDNAPQSAGVDQFAALGITPPPYDPSVDQGYLTTVVPGFETLGDDTNLPVRRQTRTLHLSETLGDRPRPSPRQDRRRAAALPVGRLQPPVLARPGRLHRRVHRPSGRRHAARLPDDHAARRQRQPAGAAHLVGERVRAGRLARLVAPDDQRRAALRVQRAAGGRRRSHGRLRPGHALGAAGGAERRAALRPRLGLQQLRAARRRQLGSHRPRHAGDARRLRPLLRQRHADRELGALLQPAVLAAAALLPERAGPDLDRRPVPDRHRRSRPRRRSTRSPAGSAPATRSRRASAWSARSPRSR